jgi:hypothetical protein
MFCPQCGSNQSDELKFCKVCGANLYAVRQVVATRETGEKFDWSKTWVAEMFLSEDERQRRKGEIEQLQGMTPEVKRYNEIKAGVITSSVGLGVMIFLYIFMQGIILGGKVPHDTAEILSRLWVAGVIPLFVGIALIINGAFVSKKLVGLASHARQTEPNLLEKETEPHALRSADTTEFTPSGFSVTEGTTQRLEDSGQRQQTPHNA